MRCVVTTFQGETVRIPVGGMSALTVGSAADNDLVLSFPGVSRYHARLIVDDGRLFLRDLGSKNRIVVAGNRVDEVELHEGVLVHLGRAALTIEEMASSDAETALRTGATRRPATVADEETGSEIESPEGDLSPASALRAIRAIERAGEQSLRRDARPALRLVQEVLGVTSVALLLRTDGEPGLVAVAGEVPSASAVEYASAVLARRGRQAGQASQVIDGRLVAAIPCGKRRGGEACLVAEGARTRLHAWEWDFLSYVAHRLGGAPAEERPRSEEIPDLALPPGMVTGDSVAMQRLLSQIHSTAHSQLDVLLWGETGTGKEVFARLLHMNGPAPKGPFVAINCAAIPNDLLEAELFGVEGRVATGVDPRPGRFMLANHGTIFLDEIGELAEGLQAKLLRVLEEREVLPLGARAPRRIDVRVIAASNRDLVERIHEKRFRPDLYYRLRRLQFHIPPLRDRREDIPELVLAFVRDAAEKEQKRILGVSRKALDLLMSHDWPGNVRELQSEVARAVLMCRDGGTLRSDSFGAVKWAVEGRGGAQEVSGAAGMLRGAQSPRSAPVPPSPAADAAGSGSLQDRVDAVEREAITEALRRARGNRSKAAKLLGITRNGLAMKMARLGIVVE